LGNSAVFGAVNPIGEVFSAICAAARAESETALAARMFAWPRQPQGPQDYDCYGVARTQLLAILLEEQ